MRAFKLLKWSNYRRLTKTTTVPNQVDHDDKGGGGKLRRTSPTISLIEDNSGALITNWAKVFSVFLIFLASLLIWIKQQGRLLVVGVELLF